MGDASETARWEATVELAVGVVAVAALVGLALVAAPFIGGDNILGLPSRTFLAGLLAPIFLVVAIFWLARRQDKLYRRFDAAED